jgi:hypothetical protein
MSVAKLVCGQCGVQLAHRDAFCPGCGVKIDRIEERGEKPAVRCPVCGHQNEDGGRYCESCGAGLPGEKKEGRGARKKEPASRGTGPAKPKGKYEPWQILSAIAVLALIVFLVFTYFPREDVKPASSAAPGPQAVPLPKQVSIEPYQKAVDAHPGDPDALLRLANALHDNGTFGRAIGVYKKYLSIVPGNPDARVDMGICYFQLAQTDSVNASGYLTDALKEMETAYKGSPTHQTAAFNLGIVNLHLGNLEESNRWFRRAVEIDKNTDLGIKAQKILAQHAFIQ